MTAYQRLQIEQRNLRRELGEIMAKSELEDSERERMRAINTRMVNLQDELTAAQLLEPETKETRTETPDSETREMRALFDKASILDYVAEGMGTAQLSGASLELRQELMPEDSGIGYFPVDILFGGLLETRADVLSSVPAADAPEENQRPIGQPVQPGSVADYLGIKRPTVPVGTSTWLTLSAGPTADYRLEGKGKDAQAISLVSKSVDPVRVTTRVKFGSETTFRVKGYEAAVNQALRNAMSEKLDAVAVTGQAASSNVSPKIEGLINSLTSPANPSDPATWADILGIYPGRVDGKYSQDGSNVRLLVAPDVFKFAHGLQIETSGNLLKDALPDGRFKASSFMPDQTNAKIATTISYTSGHTGYYQPVWRGARIIRDDISGAASGTISATLIMFSGAVLVDAKPYSLIKLKLA